MLSKMGLTTMTALPAMLLFNVSVAVTVWLPGVTNVRPLVNTCTPSSPDTNV